MAAGGRAAGAGIVILALSALGCAGESIPSKYVKEARRDVSLTELRRHPESYDGNVVILGGVVIEKRYDDGQIWLLMRNRPLDGDFVPHLPADQGTIDSSTYWLLVSPEGLPKNYDQWARLTVVGRVTAQPYPQLGSVRVPVLIAMYLKGWGESWGGYGESRQTWETIQSPNAMLSAPKPVLKKE
jgi:starvation-inducible outer membrane lipoprotein